MSIFNFIKTLIQGHQPIACKYISFHSRKVLYVNHSTKSYYVGMVFRPNDTAFPAKTLMSEDFKELLQEIEEEYKRWI